MAGWPPPLASHAVRGAIALVDDPLQALGGPAFDAAVGDPLGDTLGIAQRREQRDEAVLPGRSTRSGLQGSPASR